MNQGKKNCWTNLKVKLDLNNYLTRKILFEKLSSKSKIIDFFVSTIDGCELYSHSDCKDIVFYIKNINDNPVILMEQYTKKKNFFISHFHLWSILRNTFDMNDRDIEFLVLNLLENILKLKGYRIFDSRMNATDES